MKISGAYLRAGIDGTPTLNVGERGAIERLPDSDFSAAGITKIEKRLVPQENLDSTQGPLVVRGNVSERARRSEFTRRDGTMSFLTSFEISNEASSSGTRVVLWENPNPMFDALKSGEQITLVNVRAKSTEFQGSKSLELHGDDSTLIMENWDKTWGWMKEQFEGL